MAGIPSLPIPPTPGPPVAWGGWNRKTCGWGGWRVFRFFGRMIPLPFCFGELTCETYEGLAKETPDSLLKCSRYGLMKLPDFYWVGWQEVHENKRFRFIMLIGRLMVVVFHFIYHSAVYQVIKKQHATIICMFYFISLKLGNDPFNFSMITPILSILKARNVSDSQLFMPRSDQELRRKTVWDSAECGHHLWWRASQTLKVRTSKHGQFDSLIICIVNL